MATEPTERRTVGEVSVRSAAKLTFALSLALAAVVFVGLFALYLLGAVSGANEGVEGFVESLGWADFQINIFGLIPAFVFLSLVWAGVMTGLAAAAAVLYNVLAEIVGGVELYVRRR